MNNKKPSLLIAVPTYQRPQMLCECLDAILKIDLPEKVDISLVVVDNDKKQSAYITVDEFIQNTSSFPIVYRVEPKAGLSNIRNHILDYAVIAHADYLAFMDDDDMPDKRWLIELYNGIQTDGIDAFCGSNKPDSTAPYKTTRVPGGNVILSKRIFKDLNIRFDPILNTIGHEDVDYFKRAEKAGAVIYASPRPKAITRDIEEKRTFKEESLFLFNKNLSYQRFLRLHRGKWKIQIVIAALLYLIKGTLFTLPSLFSKRIRKRCITAFLKFAAYIFSLANMSADPYKTPSGN